MLLMFVSTPYKVEILHIYAGDEIAILTEPPLLLKLHIIKAMMPHAQQVPVWRILSVSPVTYDCCLPIIGLPSCSTEVL